MQRKDSLPSKRGFLDPLKLNMFYKFESYSPSVRGLYLQNLLLFKRCKLFTAASFNLLLKKPPCPPKEGSGPCEIVYVL